MSSLLPNEPLGIAPHPGVTPAPLPLAQDPLLALEERAGLSSRVALPALAPSPLSLSARGSPSFPSPSGDSRREGRQRASGSQGTRAGRLLAAHSGSRSPRWLPQLPDSPPGSAPRSRHPGPTCCDSKATAGTGFPQGVQGWRMLRVSPQTPGLAVLGEEEEAWRGTHGKMEKRSSEGGGRGGE